MNSTVPAGAAILLNFISISPRVRDIRGQRYGKLVVRGPVGRDAQGRVLWHADCDCGGHIVDRAYNVARNVGCGCHQAERMGRLRLRHGQNRKSTGRTRTYYSWQAMLKRCCNPHAEQYPDYGGRGIAVCDRWRTEFQAFFQDMGERPPGKTLDRIDNDGGYEPDNCRWATPLEQRHNQRPRRPTSQESAHG